MALRQLRFEGDELLRKKSKKVTDITKNIINLLDDMKDTMVNENGVGLAAPQVGVLRRVVIIDIGEGLIELINPEIIEMEGEQENDEGCLSVPGMTGVVKRPERVVVKALNRNGEEITIEGTDLLAIALCHELDHLDGVLYIDKAANIRKKSDDNENDGEYDED